MATLDDAFASFRAIRSEYATACVGERETEAEARLRLIDRILFEVLGWPRNARLELQKDEDRLDYLLRDNQGANWAVVEAKRPEIQLVNPNGAGKDGTIAFKIGGPACDLGTPECASEVLCKQLSRYSALYGTSVSVATTGIQWVGAVIPSRSGKELRDDRCVMFGSLDAIEHSFERFHQYFSLSGIPLGHLGRVLLDDDAFATIRCERPFRIVRVPQPVITAPHEVDQYYSELERAADIAFDPIEDDPHIIEHCFVESRESRDADDRLARLAELLTERLALGVAEYQERIRDDSERVQAVDGAPQAGHGTLALLTGEFSSGKTTYVRRFFGHMLEAGVRSKIRYVHVRFDKVGDIDTASSIRRAISDALYGAIFGEEGPDPGQFLDLFAPEWKRHRQLFGEDADSKRRFMEAHLASKSQEPGEFSVRAVDLVARRHRKLPVLILDGFDHLPPVLQEAVLDAAVSIFLRSFAVVTVLADDATLWRLRREGRDTLFARYATMRLWLPRSKVGEVLTNRLEYLRKVFAPPVKRGGRATTTIGRGLTWTLDADAVIGFIRDALLFGDEEVRHWVEEFANFDVLRMLRICRTIILSPVVKRESVFLGLVTGEHTPLTRPQILTALIRPHHHHFHEGPENFVHNVYGFGHDGIWCPLGPLALLLILDERYRTDRESALEIAGFMSMNDVEDIGSSVLKVPRGLVRRMAEWLRSSDLIQPYDPSAARVDDGNQSVKITPRGRLHARWAVGEWQYMYEMGLVDAICTEGVYNAMSIASEATCARDTEMAGLRAFARSYGEYLLHRYQLPTIAASGHPRVAEQLGILRDCFIGDQVGPVLTAQGGRKPRTVV